MNIDEAKQFIDKGNMAIIDIRDPDSFSESHIPEAMNVTGDNIETFITTADKNKPLLCYCYHGISSQGAAAYLKDQGFREVYSLDGGFEAWRVAD